MNIAKWFRGIRGKLLLMVGISFGISMISGALVLWGLTTMSKNVSEITENSIPSIEGIGEMNEGQMAAMYAAYRAVTTDSKQELEVARKLFNEKILQIDKGSKTFEVLEKDADESKAWEELKPKWATWEADAKKVLELAERGQRKDAEDYLDNQVKSSMEKTEMPLDSLMTANLKSVGENEAILQKSNSRLKLSTLSISICGALLMLLLGFLIATKLSSLFGQIAASLTASSLQVSAGSGQIASASQELSQATTEQAAALEQTAAAIEQISSMITKNSESAKNTAASSEHSQETANKGKKAVEAMAEFFKKDVAFVFHDAC
jgi:methyl-accepting chemotaxis protein